MREIPGYYFDEARNRYFKIERGGIRANDANLGDGDASSDGRRAYYDVDTLRKIKRQKEDEAAQRTLEAIRVRSIKLHLKDCQLPQRIEQRFSPLSFLLASRSHGIPNRTGRMFTHSFIKPYMPRLLKKTERFQFTANATTAADVGIFNIFTKVGTFSAGSGYFYWAIIVGKLKFLVCSSESYIIAGGEASFSVLPLSQAYPSLYRCHSPSAVLTVSFLPQQ
ncbi:hypothetical protein L0F63_005096, partial [Massospora cicadina]